MTDTRRAERRHCETHEATQEMLTGLRIDMKIHNVASRRIFACGLVMIGLSISALIYFGGLNERVNHLEGDMRFVKKTINAYHGMVD